MIGNRVSFMLILAMSKLSSFDDNRRFFDTSSMVRFRSPPDHTPDIYDNAFSSSLTTKALYSSSMKGFDASFRKPTPRGLPSSYIQFQFLLKLNVAHLDSNRSTSRSDSLLPSIRVEAPILSMVATRRRAVGWGPLFLKIGGRVVYRVEDILAYEEQHLADSTQSRVCNRGT